MHDLSQIIIWVLWRLRPVMAVEMNLSDIIATGFAMFSDDDDLVLMEDPNHCAMILAGIADANTKLDLLIYLRACETLGIRSRARDFKPNRTATRSGRTAQECWARFRRLAIRFQDYERLAQKRAERLQREQSESPLRLAATLQSTSPALCAEEDSRLLLEVLHRRRRGRWIGASSRRDGGGSAQPRGPPFPPNFPDSTQLRLAVTSARSHPHVQRLTPSPHPPT